MRIAITGGIASGKSEIRKVFESAGYKAVSADAINQALLLRADYIAKLGESFPSAVKDGAVDKAELRRLVFDDESARLKLNAIAHPIIFGMIADIKGDVVAEIPLLFESGFQRSFDKVIVATAPESVRLKRLSERNGYSEQFAKKIMAAQTSDEVRFKGADFVVDTDCSLSELAARVNEIIKQL